MKKTIIILFSLLSVGTFSQTKAQNCREKWHEAQRYYKHINREDRNSLIKAKMKYQDVIDCGDKFYYEDSRNKIKDINDLLQQLPKPDPQPDPPEPDSLDYPVEKEIEAHQTESFIWNLKLKDNNYELKFNKNEYPWLTIEKGENKTVIIKCNDNQGEKRTAYFLIRDQGANLKYKVIQKEGTEQPSPLPVLDWITIQSKESYFVTKGLQQKKLPDNPKVTKSSEWIEQKDYYVTKSKNIIKAILGIPNYRRVEKGMASFMVTEPYYGPNDYREGFIDIEGWGRIIVKQERKIVSK